MIIWRTNQSLSDGLYTEMLESIQSNHKNKNVGDVITSEGINQILWPDHCVQQSLGSDFPKNFN